MKEQLPFFNFSLKKVLALEEDSFKKAKIKIILIILVFTIIKLFVVVPVAMEFAQNRQLFRALVILVVFSVLIKLILYRPSSVTVISHIMLVSGVAVIWSNVLVYAHQINIVTVQLIFMTALVSYYLIGGVKAACYTMASILSVVFYMSTRNSGWDYLNITPQVLASPGVDIIILLNFTTFVLIHYLYYQAFHENLKEKELLNLQLKVNIQEAKALAESRSVFLSTMSHELRTPLNGVIGMTNLIKDTALEEQKEYLNILEFSATNLLSVINDILDYNKIELDKIALEAIPVNLPVLLQKICNGLGIKAAEKALTWDLEVDEELKDKLVVTDPTRLTQIIYNLAGNAIKFTSNGMVGVAVKVTKQIDDNITVRFSICDTGIGIAADRQEAVFEMFTQASSDTTRNYGGTGLGLAIVKKLLKLFNSSIELESLPGKGSVFSFTVDFALYQGEIDRLPDYNLVKTSMKGLKLLIAEDNNINVLLLQKLLAKWDVQTVVVGNGQEAVDSLLKNNFDGILMDIHMPVMDGYASTLAIRALSDQVKSHIPIIAITASVSDNVYERISEVGMQDFLPKPFQADQLYEKLQQIYKPAC